VADLGGVRGVRPHPPWRPLEKIQGLLISKIVRTADSTIIIIANFYLAAGSHEIFLRVGGTEGMKGIGAFQRHQLPHPPCKNPASATGSIGPIQETGPQPRTREVFSILDVISLAGRIS